MTQARQNIISLSDTPYYHVSGFTYPTVSIIKMDEPNVIYPSTWGFIPDWAEKDIPSFRKKYNTLNAKRVDRPSMPSSTPA